MKMNILDCDTVALDDENSALEIIDQTLLPNEIKIIGLKTQKEIWEAIYSLRVRGAPAIGVAAGIGLYLAAKEINTGDRAGFFEKLSAAKDYLASSRPTAVNLKWALERMERAAENESGSVADIKRSMLIECRKIWSEDIEVCEKLGENALALVKPGDGLLTHCNAGQLATVRYGTATAPMYLGQKRGYGFKVYCDETRPLLQGARLTSFELSSAGIDTTLICDNMAASLMKSGKINAVFVGCDRVAANGDAANKIGTLSAAIAAKRFGVPFYVVAPSSTIDMNTKCGADIVIEERPGDEICEMWYEKRMAPRVIKTWNPAFDVTDSDLIAAIVTEYGIARAPYDRSLREIFNRKNSADEQR
ncbi:MAG: S-methyl-5-thioribose-1-phosphate isomerase [Oscillospiraceae bacterium]|nr:S-methyl-5-thioribose-1-phosphate isomerase [Oscillospiraceae bacterium]